MKRDTVDTVVPRPTLREHAWPFLRTWLALGVAFTVAFMVVLTGQASRAQLELESSRSASTTLTKRAAESTLDFAATDLLVLAVDLNVDSLAGGTSNEAERLRLATLFSAFLEKKPGLQRIGVVTATGQDILGVTAAGEASGANWGEHPSFAGTRDLATGEVSVTVLGAETDGRDGSAVVRIATQVASDSEQPPGYVYMDIAAIALAGGFLSNIGDQQLAYLIDENGDVLLGAHASERWGTYFGAPQSFADEQPHRWRTVAAGSGGREFDSDGMYAYSTVFPDRIAERLAGETDDTLAYEEESKQWKIVSVVPREELPSASLLRDAPTFLTFVSGLLAMASIAALIAHATAVRRALQRSIRELAETDSLTGLPNRRVLADRLAQALTLADRNGSHAAVMFLDLDRFKDVNDRYGHDIGDRFLQGVAARLVASVRKGDTVARQGGDEFIVLLPQLDGVEEAERVAQRILDGLAEPIDLGEHQLRAGTSIGVAVRVKGEGADDLIAKADAAMYEAKQGGRNQYRLSVGVKNPVS
ncbi:sensor domain-containing diguanylate cyclase [Salinibacterium sp. SYSU T00001]|uniref:sensor domain-containing diguanylate cyclase n=1 Tax=Homoserinimonas sedimenticola TaxID=2986805 RepID=UPI002236289F|nr:sensor domain-containing diguanylate cyclase [Salinibacterium sedimenticola]MCW4386245.1 sensor domain-containing diguanylate cyclase [Salinibacterium sedimenticola]